MNEVLRMFLESFYKAYHSFILPYQYAYKNLQHKMLLLPFIY
jgi:hypothetical protein